MTSQQQSDVPSESVDPQQLLHLVQDAKENIRLAKRTQWNVANYTLLLDGALVFVADRTAKIPWADIALVVLVLLIFVTFLGGVIGLCQMEQWMKKNRALAERAETNFCNVYQELLPRSLNNYAGDKYEPTIPYLLLAVVTIAFSVTLILVLIEFCNILK